MGETTVVFEDEQERDYRGNPVRRCIACRRVRWDGGHAINDRECRTTGDDACRCVVAEAEAATLRAENDRLRAQLDTQVKAHANDLARVVRAERALSRLEKLERVAEAAREYRSAALAFMDSADGATEPALTRADARLRAALRDLDEGGEHGK